MPKFCKNVKVKEKSLKDCAQSEVTKETGLKIKIFVNGQLPMIFLLKEIKH